MENKIKELSEDAIIPLYNLSLKGAKSTKEFIINCSDLEDFNYIDITKSAKYKTIFADFKTLSGPCLYYFEIISDNRNDAIIQGIKEYAASENSKSIPAIKKTIPNSKYLYVGKVKRHLWGRMIHHFGFYKVQRTQGLQLYYWAKQLNLDLKLVVFEFENEMVNLMEVLESGIAKELKPILGRHK